MDLPNETPEQKKAREQRKQNRIAINLQRKEEIFQTDYWPKMKALNPTMPKMTFLEYQEWERVNLPEIWKERQVIRKEREEQNKKDLAQYRKEIEEANKKREMRRKRREGLI